MEFRKLKAEEIDVRVQSAKANGVILLLYKDARCDMNILDETIGCMNWERKHEVIDGRLYCTVSLYDERTNRWVSKQDVGTESNTEKEKGQASDSFKRACFNWGIGRELYTSPFIWVDSKKANIVQRGNSYACNDKFKVKSISYKNNAICQLTIVTDKGKEVFNFGRSNKEHEEQVKTENTIDIGDVYSLGTEIGYNTVQLTNMILKKYDKTPQQLSQSEIETIYRGLSKRKGQK